VLFSSFIGIVSALVIGLFTRGIFTIPVTDVFLLMFTGLLTIVWIVLYLYALEIEEVSSVAPWFLTVPIFGYIFGNMFLGEVLTQHQLIGSIIILVGVIVLSLNFSRERKRFKHKPVLYMVVACILVALSGVIFKCVTVENNFWASSFWEYAGLGLSGLLIYIFIPKYRREFMHMNKHGGRKIFIVNTISELATITGNLMTNFALLLAPVTMVYLVGSFQPAIVLFMTLACTKFFPQIVMENMSKRVLLAKMLAIAIMTVGSIFLFMV
jgi:drug/metabolite transporter (DMT)-like permease